MWRAAALTCIQVAHGVGVGLTATYLLGSRTVPYTLLKPSALPESAYGPISMVPGQPRPHLHRHLRLHLHLQLTKVDQSALTRSSHRTAALQEQS